MLILLSVALARPKVAPPPAKIETVAEGLTFFRPGDEAEGEDPAPPDGDSQAAYEGWVRTMESLKDRRADLVEADTLLRDYAPLIADCAVKVGAAVGAGVQATVTLSSGGVIHLSGASGDAGLKGCLVATLDKHQTGAILHGGKNIEPKYTFTLVGAPAAVASGVDVEASFGGVRFGESSDHLIDPHLSTSYRNTTHYTRAIDDNVMFMGVDCLTAYDFDGGEGLYGGEVRVSGDDASFRMRENLKARFGQGKWDGALKAWYWRGARFIYVSQRVPDTTYEVLRVLDMERTKHAGLVQSLPGDEAADQPSAVKALPRVLREEGATPAKP